MEHIQQIKVQAKKRNCIFAIHEREWIVFEELHTRKWDQSYIEIIIHALTIWKQTWSTSELYILVKWKEIDHNFEACPIIIERSICHAWTDLSFAKLFQIEPYKER